MVVPGEGALTSAKQIIQAEKKQKVAGKYIFSVIIYFIRPNSPIKSE